MIELSYGFRRLTRVVSSLQRKYDKSPTSEIKARLDKYKEMLSARDTQGIRRAMGSMNAAINGRERFYKFEAIGELVEFGFRVLSTTERRRHLIKKLAKQYRESIDIGVGQRFRVPGKGIRRGPGKPRIVNTKEHDHLPNSHLENWAMFLQGLK